MKQFCIHGHDTFIVGRNTEGACKGCAKEYAHKRHKANLNKSREAVLNWEKKNPEKAERTIRNSAYRMFVNPDGSRFTIANYDNLYVIQQGQCSICSRHSTEFKKRFHVDHDHKTGRVRSLLCSDCNTGIGLLQEDIDLLEKAKQYLQKNRN